MTDKNFGVELATPEREFVKVYKDFMRTSLLSAEEKLTYIALKCFAEYRKDSDSVWPSMTTLASLTSMSEPRTRRAIKSLEKKGLLKKQRRGLRQPNIYTIWDVPYVWESSTEEELHNRSSLTEDEVMAERLRQRGYVVYKEKGLSPVPCQSSDESPNESENSYKKHTNKAPSSQPQDIPAPERYTHQDIEALFDFDVVQEQLGADDSAMVFDILYDILNTRADTIRIGSEDKPAMVVIGKMMKLQYDDIVYAVNKFNDQSTRITNPVAYLRTILYHAKEQHRLDMLNEGHVNGDF